MQSKQSYTTRIKCMDFQSPATGTILYKYYPPDIATLILSNKKIRFSPFIEFNDPFELNTYATESFTEYDFGFALANQIYDAIEKKENLAGKGPLVELVKAYIQGQITDISPYDFALDLGVTMAKKKFLPGPTWKTRIIRQRLAKTLGAFCLSENNNNLLMWAHYAKNHEGVVIGIDTTFTNKIFTHIAPVKYQIDYPSRTDPHQSAAIYLGRNTRDEEKLESIEQMLFTKSIDWSYEKEWRAIRDNNCDPLSDHKLYEKETQLAELPSEAFSSIYIGCRCAPKKTQELIEKARSINPNIKTFKVRTSSRSYALEFHDYDETWPDDYIHEGQVI